MTIPDEVKTLLSEATDISLGYSEINFIEPMTLDDAQIGYRVDTNGNSLITGNDGDWQEEWLVIANDQMGDPIIIDLSSHKLKVLSAVHGEGTWEPFVIADSIDNFKNFISVLREISKDRINPVDIEKNPVSETERKIALKEIQRQNPDTELWYWENFFEND